MNCERLRPLLSAYLDGELDPERYDLVVDHLAACPDCARLLGDFRALGQDIRALRDDPVPAGMRDEFRTRLRQRRNWPTLIVPQLAGSLLSIVFVIALVALAIGMSRAIQQMKALGHAAEIVASYPLDGATDVSLDTKLTLTFARPMDQVSVEEAIHITPEVQLAFAWQGKALTVVPFVDWQPATTYTLTVANTAREVEGALLEEPISLRFTTAGESSVGLLNPIGRFGYLWRAELGGPGGALGYATAEEQEFWSAVQPFVNGLMVWLDRLHEDHIYVLVYDQDESHGTWRRYTDTWREGDPESAGLTPPEGLLEPIRGFGRLWREELGGPDAPIGWALASEQGCVGAMQPFEHGVMLWNPLSRTAFVLWEDGAWTAYPSSQ